MLWILYTSNQPINCRDLEFLRLQFGVLKKIGDNIFPLVGLVDLRANSVLLYDAMLMGDRHDSNVPTWQYNLTVSVFTTLLLKNTNRLALFGEAPGSTSASVLTGSSGTSQQPRQTTNDTPLSKSNPGSRSSGHQGTSSSSNGGGDFSSSRSQSTPPSDRSGSDEQNSPNRRRRNDHPPPDSPSGSNSDPEDEDYPFECKAQFIGTDGQAQSLFLRVFLKCKPGRGSQLRGPMSRIGCSLVAERFEAGIVGDDLSAFLKVEQMQLDMGPSLEGLPAERAGQRDACLAGITMGDQRPRKTDFVPTRTRTNENGIEVGGGFPWSTSLKENYRKGRFHTLPTQTVGLDVGRIQIRAWKANNFLWCYPVAKAAEPFVEGPVDHSLRLSDHSGDFSYLTQNPPSSMNLELTVNYRILGRRVFIQNQGKNYPCRSVRFKFEVKILPNENSQFLYPRDGSSGLFIDLGTFRFIHDPEGHSVLQILRDDNEVSGVDLDIPLSNQSDGPAWTTQKVAAGIIETKDCDGMTGFALQGAKLT